MTKTEKYVWEEMARRKVVFHPNEEWHNLRLWGLFNWGDVKKLLERGDLHTTMEKENKIIWVWPSDEAYHKYIEPILNDIESGKLKIKGWELVSA